MPKKTKTVHRSAVDGEFTTQEEAAARPREHIKQQVPVRKGGGKKK